MTGVVSGVGVLPASTWLCPALSCPPGLWNTHSHMCTFSQQKREQRLSSTPPEAPTVPQLNLAWVPGSPFLSVPDLTTPTPRSLLRHYHRLDSQCPVPSSHPSHHRPHHPLCFVLSTDVTVFLKGVSHRFMYVDYVKL